MTIVNLIVFFDNISFLWLERVKCACTLISKPKVIRGDSHDNKILRSYKEVLWGVICV
ncbi:MAG: hypothetical protein UX41_C0018G0020 [Candidatus Collierbacteria bacterium GW2011_GWE1_46_18]|uniref:Uncharacterized protein n=1 Tax=Candidatus Collierbacteria bacterium GW2011_GWE1_46_18 TaxID=1618399 RepID=A0A0G1RHI6_9BACT|nr:MAG: hypothetical protein UX41_C0018G0020 [Candidatus Collierbacteria bacterium GW2011_GWE1_46_18]